MKTCIENGDLFPADVIEYLNSVADRLLSDDAVRGHDLRRSTSPPSLAFGHKGAFNCVLAVRWWRAKVCGAVRSEHFDSQKLSRRGEAAWLAVEQDNDQPEQMADNKRFKPSCESSSGSPERRTTSRAGAR